MNRYHTRLTTCLILSGALTGASLAVSAESSQEAGFTGTLGVGTMHFDSTTSLEDQLSWHLNGGYRFDSPFAVELGYIKADPNGADTSPDAETDQWRADVLYHFPLSGRYIEPFISAGFGHRTYDYSGGGEIDESAFNLGVGAKVWITERMAFRADLKAFRDSDGDRQDIAVNLGMHFALGHIGKPRTVTHAEPKMQTTGQADSDGDGVFDGRDQCPGTPRNVAVDNTGCALDSDGDGVADYADACPDTSSPQARVDERGCYVTLEETVSIELDVKFDVDSAEARPEHRAEVEKLYRFMMEYPQTRITVEGHTDDTGAAEYNEDLSQRRADAIAEMLIEEFDIDADRVSAVGYGESRPVASNETASGRAQNRRVVGVIETTVERVETR